MGPLRPHSIAACLVILLSFCWFHVTEARRERGCKGGNVFIMLDASRAVKRGQFKALRQQTTALALSVVGKRQKAKVSIGLFANQVTFQTRRTSNWQRLKDIFKKRRLVYDGSKYRRLSRTLRKIQRSLRRNGEVRKGRVKEKTHVVIFSSKSSIGGFSKFHILRLKRMGVKLTFVVYGGPVKPSDRDIMRKAPVRIYRVTSRAQLAFLTSKLYKRICGSGGGRGKPRKPRKPTRPKRKTKAKSKKSNPKKKSKPRGKTGKTSKKNKTVKKPKTTKKGKGTKKPKKKRDRGKKKKKVDGRLKRCPKSYVLRGRCKRGLIKVKHFYYIRNRRGTCLKKSYNRVSSCKPSKFCKCFIVGDPHYITYDGQPVHFYGICKYTLTRLKPAFRKDPCFFKIEHKTEHRGVNKLVSYLRLLDIKMFGHTFRLHQRKRLYVDGKIQGTPYVLGKKVRIFVSGTYIQFVAPKCGIKVAFDGRMNAFIQVAGRYRGNMKGICGDCNGKRLDDLRTKAGTDVRSMPSTVKYNMIGDSYNVPDDSDKPVKKCKTPPAPKKFCKTRRDKRRAKRICYNIHNIRGPFRKCILSRKVSSGIMAHDCVIDSCVTSHSRKLHRRAICEAYKGMAEACAEAGFPGIKWRSPRFCPLHCGRNAFYSVKVNPCPKTCENHFFGTKSLCYKLPRREACQCKPGYVLDGALCVKPKNCKCLELCIDRVPVKQCRQWKRQGRCAKFPRAMREICPLTCGMCKTAKSKCVDHISTIRCERFRREGKCRQSFYRNICHLTCNARMCPCPKKYKTTTPCHKKFKFRTVRIHYFKRNSRGQCFKVIRVSYKPCGKCRTFKRVKVGRCNFCKRRRTVKIIARVRRGHRCVLIKRKRTSRCNCPGRGKPKKKRVNRCLGNSVRLRINISYRINGCFRCLKIRRVQRFAIRCRRPWVVKQKCGKRTFRFVKKFTERPRKCICIRRVRVRYQRCRCKKPYTKKICRNRCMLHIKVHYKKTALGCHKIRRLKRNCAHCKRPKLIKRKCDKSTCRRRWDRIFYVLMDNCKCKKVVNSFVRRCCCPPPIKRVGCDKPRGLLIRITTRHRLIRGKCHHTRLVKKRKIYCSRRPIKRAYSCNLRNCLQRVSVTRLFRRGCRCKRRVVHFRRLCCCKPAYRVFTQCRNGRYVYKHVQKRVLKNFRCLTKKRIILTRIVRCKRPEIRRGVCNPKTRHRKLMITRFRLRACRCIRQKPTMRHVVCGCPRARIRRFRCNTKTCKRRLVISGYRIKGNRCLPVKKVRYLKCCCLKKGSKTTHCEKRRGRILSVRVKYIYSAKLRACIRKVVRRYHYVFCRGKRKYIKGKCNKKTMYARDQFLFVRLRRSTCKCQVMRRIRRRRCACPKCKKTKKRCYGRKMRWKKICFTLRGRRCRKTVHKRYQFIFCKRSIKRKNGKCNKKTCRQINVVSYNVRRKCRCVRRKRKYVRFCCCPKARKTMKCAGGRALVRKVIRYRLNRRRTRCLKHISKFRRTVRCKRRKIIKVSKCNRKVCKYIRTVKYFRVRGCKCVKYKQSIRARRCCCPADKKSIKCIPRRGRKAITIIRYHLRRGTCQKTTIRKLYRIVCPKDKIRGHRCRKGQNYQKVSILSFKRQGCTCVRKHIIRKRICRCPGDRLVRSRCRRGAMTRHVYHIRFKLNRKKRRCTKQVVRVFREACRCPRGRRSVRCRRGLRISKKIIYIKRRVRGLILCVKRIRVRKVKIRCRNGRKYWTPCRYYRKYLRKYVYRPTGCKCRLYRIRTIVARACGCRRRNRTQKMCRGRYIIFKRWTYYTKGPICAPVIKKRVRKLRCSRRVRRRRIRPCTLIIRRLKGIYRLYREKRYKIRGCRCVPKFRVIKKLCRCLPPRTRKRCLISRGIMVRTTVRYHPQGNRCRSVYRTTKRVRSCAKSVHVERRRCNRKRCVVILKVTFFMKSGCQCRKSRLFVRTKCCCKLARKETNRCAKRSGILMRRITRRRLVVSGIKFKWGRFTIPRYRCKTSIKTIRRRITCARSKTVKKKCNSKTGVYTKHKSYFVQKGCKCIRRVEKIHGRCRCRSTQRRVGKCIGHFRRITLMRFVLVRGKCERRVKRRRERCRCYRPSKSVRCDGRGNIVTTVTKYRLTPDKRCERITKRHKRPVVCNRRLANARLFKRGPCDYRKSKKRTLYFVKVVLNRSRCHCNKKIWLRRVPCSCRRSYKKSKRVCKNGYIRQKEWKQVLIGNRCVRQSRTLSKSVVCPPNKTVYGPCKLKGKGKGWLMKNLTVYRKFGCKCFRKIFRIKMPCQCSAIGRFAPKKRVLCKKNNQLVTVRMYYTARAGTCTRRQLVTIKTIVCRRGRYRKRYHKCNKKTCNYKISIYKYSVRKCKCSKTKHKIITRKCCCPKKKVVRRKCLRHNIRYTAVKRYRLVRGKCHGNLYVSRIKVKHCRGRRVRGLKCNRKTCDQTFNYFKRKVVNCKCRFVKIATAVRKCCCPKNKRKVKCDKRAGKILIIKSNYRLKKGFCMKYNKIKVKKIRCTSKKWTKAGVCKGRTRRMKMFEYRRKGCKCVPRLVRMYILGCKCKKYTWTKKFPCPSHGKGNSRKVVLYGHDYNRFKGKCFTRILKETRIPCRCRGRKRFVRRCLRHVILRHIHISWRIKKRTGECVKIRRVRDRTFRCSVRSRFIRRHSGRCNAKGYQTDTYYYSYARNCVCRTKIRHVTWPCNCRKIHKSKKRRFCKGRFMVTVVKHWRSVRRECKQYKIIKRTPIYCSRRKIKRRSKCRKVKTKKGKGKGKVRSLRFIMIYKASPVNCKCRWRRVKKIAIPCGCPRAKHARVCIASRKQLRITKTRYRLIRGRCYRSKKLLVINVRCKVGVKTRRQKCLKGQRRYSIVHFQRTFNPVRCRCYVRKWRRTCDCSCPKPRKYVSCGRRNGIRRVIKVRYIKKLCRCVKISSIVKSRIICKPKKPKIGRCNQSSGYRQVIYYRIIRNGCRCQKKMKLANRVCYCRRERRGMKICFKNKYRIRLRKQRVISYKKNKCVWRTVSLKKRRVSCGRTRVITRCNKKTKVETVTVLRPIVRNCRCRRARKVYKRKCKCRTRRRFFRSGRCNRKKCEKVSTYIYEVLKGKKCVRRYMRRRHKCCCPKSFTRRYCITRKGIHRRRTIRYRLRRGHCLSHVVRRDRKIVCPMGRKLRKTCNKKTGVGFIKIFGTRRVGCKCRSKLLRKIRVVCACTKKAGYSSRCYRNQRKRVSKRWRYVIKKQVCIKLLTVKVRKIACSPTQVIVTPCNRRTGIRKKIRVWYYINNLCRCVRRKRVSSRVCLCRPAKRVIRKCDSKRGIKRLTIKTKRLEGGTCVRYLKRYTARIRCAGIKRLRKMGVCRGGRRKLTYELKVRRGCRCVKKRIHRHCICSCPRHEVRRICRGVSLKKTVIRYKLIGCRCQRLVQRYSRVVVCPKTKYIRTTCGARHRCIKEIRKIRFVRRNCRCIKIKKIIRKRCCCPPKSVKNICLSRRGIIIRRRVSYQLRNGRCYRRVVKTKLKIRCAHRRREDPRGGCMKGKIRVLVRYYVRVKCRCVKAKKFLQKSCGCQRPILIRRRCDRRTCKRRVTLISFYKEKGKGKCKRKSEKRLQRCCCRRRSKHRKVCSRGRLLRITYYRQFRRLTRSCMSRKRVRDITPRCSPRRLVKRGSCNPRTGIIRFTVIRRRLSKCKCKKTIKVFKQRCRCPKSKFIRKCDKHGRRRDIQTMYKLKNRRCVPRTIDRIVKIVCRGRVLKYGRCNRLTYRQSISVIKFIRRGCLCVRTLKRFNRVCGCRNAVLIKYKFCNAKKGQRFVKYFIQKYNRRRHRCVKKKVVKTVPVRCSKKVIRHSGPCTIIRGRRRYRRIIRFFVRRIACSCVRMKQIRHRLCYCGRPKYRRVCRHGVIHTLKDTYFLKKREVKKRVIVVCGRRSTLAHKKLIKCRVRPWKTSGPCNRKTGKRLIFTKVQRKRQCKCLQETRSRPTVCKCLKRPPKSRTRCVRGRIVRTRYYFKKVCRRRLCKCVLKRSFHRKVIRCKAPIVKKMRCVAGRRRVTIVVYLNRRCKCRHKVRSKNVKCRKGCYNLLPDRDCRDHERAGYCESDPRIRKICRKTCGLCFDCKKGKVAFQVFPRRGLFTDKRYSQRFFIRRVRNKKFITCRTRCARDPRCFSFEIVARRGSRKYDCIFSSVTPQKLKRRVLKFKMVKSKRHLYVKYCLRKCPQNRAVAMKKKCQCFGKGITRFCAQKFKLLAWRHDRRGRCVHFVKVVQSPCGMPCLDISSRKLCLRLRRMGRCRRAEVRVLCNKSCGACHCPTSKVRRSSCRKNKKGKWQRTYLVHNYRRFHGMCVMQVRMAIRKCKPPKRCPRGRYRIIHRCKNGFRKIDFVTLTRSKSYKCKRKIRRVKKNCSGCCEDVRVRVGKCRRDRSLRFKAKKGKKRVLFFNRRVAYKYWIRSKGCCRLRIYVRKMHCHKFACPRERSIVGPCVLRERLRYTLFYEYDRINKRCRKHYFSRREGCIHSNRVFICKDRLPKKSCIRIRKKKRCFSSTGPMLCAGTCGFCKGAKAVKKPKSKPYKRHKETRKMILKLIKKWKTLGMKARGGVSKSVEKAYWKYRIQREHKLMLRLKKHIKKYKKLGKGSLEIKKLLKKRLAVLLEKHKHKLHDKLTKMLSKLTGKAPEKKKGKKGAEKGKKGAKKGKKDAKKGKKDAKKGKKDAKKGKKDAKKGKKDEKKGKKDAKKGKKDAKKGKKDEKKGKKDEKKGKKDEKKGKKDAKKTR